MQVQVQILIPIQIPIPILIPIPIPIPIPILIPIPIDQKNKMNKSTIFFLLLILPGFLFSQNSWGKIGGKEIQLTAEIYSLTEQTVDTLYLGETPILVHSWLGQPQSAEHPVMVYQMNSSNYPATYVDSDSSFQLIEGFLNSTILNILEDPEYELLSSSLIFQRGCYKAS